MKHSIRDWLWVAKPKRGRPLLKDRAKTLEAIKPWEAEGMSRATWYARRKEKQK